ncbi:hypothetical protein ABIE78_005179 [Sinorhizobium fredii]|uniref:Uncharacterized protein n=1 Tax=Sinorhizobium fredii (strain USDA 257) TaxID=1185652 RepID=I3WZK1_SINF2|nr:hypothetical protein USDA257_c04600 [Sinorhizobium fredii USDA 257]
MAIIEQRLAAMGLERKFARGCVCVSPGYRVRGTRAYISGHVACNKDGTLAKPLGKVGTEVSPRAGLRVSAARCPGPSREPQTGGRIPRSGYGLGLRVFAMVNVAPGFNEMPLVTNGYSDLILDPIGGPTLAPTSL